MIFSCVFSAVYATKPVSGGHLNPALTLATTVSGHMHWVGTAPRCAGRNRHKHGSSHTTMHGKLNSTMCLKDCGLTGGYI